MVAWLKYCRVAGILTFTLEKLFLKNQIWAKKKPRNSQDINLQVVWWSPKGNVSVISSDLPASCKEAFPIHNGTL